MPRLMLAMVLAGLGAVASLAQDLPPENPILRIEPGMHTAPVRGLGVNVACTRMLTGSLDKTLRLWDISDRSGRTPILLRKLRPPIGQGGGGKIYAAALSPDGKWAAAGGWDVGYRGGQKGYSHVYIFNAHTGGMVARLEAINTVIFDLVFSPDGAYLAATVGHGEGLRVWRTDNWSLIAKHKTSGDADSYGAAFDNKGRLWTVAYDGRIRRYDAGFTSPPRIVRTTGGARPFSIAVHPEGERVAVGFVDSTAVEIYDAETLTRLFAADTAGVKNGNLSSVAWSMDGARLFAAGRYSLAVGGQNQIRVWAQAGAGKGRDLRGAHNTINRLRRCGSGVAFVASDPALGVIDKSGRRLAWQGPVAPEMRNKVWQHFSVSGRGSRVRFGLGAASIDPVLFDLDSEQIVDAPKIPDDLYRGDTEGLPVRGWQNSRRPSLAGKPLRLKKFESARSLAVTPDKLGFVLGADWRLRAYSSRGELRWQKNVPGSVWGINIPRAGRTVIAAYGDGTIRWHRLSDGQELLALFVHTSTSVRGAKASGGNLRKQRRWVAWTPRGYYMTSPDGENLIGWHVNQGWNKEAAFFPVKLFRSQYYRPDIVHQVLATLDEDKAVEEANKRAKRPLAIAPIAKILPPVVRILSPVAGDKVASRILTLQYTAAAQSGDKIQDVDVLVNGRPVAIQRAVPINASEDKNVISIEIAVPPEDISVSLVAWSGNGAVKRASEAVTVRLKWAGKPADPSALPRLLALFVGVSDYADNRLDLRFADKDAQALAVALKRQVGITYRSVTAKLLTNKKATRRNILKGLKWLKTEAKRDDIVMVSFAGHGMTDNNQSFHFLPHETDPAEPTLDGVSKRILRDMISRTAGKVVVFIDACHAGDAGAALSTPLPGLGPADMTGLVNELSSTEVGAIMYAASTGRQYSLERDDWGHGAFTKALLEGLAGKADLFGGRPPGIHTGELDVWLTGRVRELTNNQQTPTMVKSTVPHFTIAAAR